MSLREVLLGTTTKQSIWVATTRPAGFAITMHFANAPWRGGPDDSCVLRRSFAPKKTPPGLLEPGGGE
jgi:hypothetical protein